MYSQNGLHMNRCPCFLFAPRISTRRVWYMLLLRILLLLPQDTNHVFLGLTLSYDNAYEYIQG